MSSNAEKQKTDSCKEGLEVYTWTSGKCIDLGIILELGSIGAGHAATSLSEVLQQPIQIDIPRIHTLPVHQVTKFYHKHDTPTTAIYIQLREESECDILLLFEANEAKKIAAMMTMSPSPEEMEPSMEASAIEELANILIGSFLSAISDFSGVKLLPTPPLRVMDSFDAILDNFLVKQSLVSHEALIFDTCFKSQNGGGNCVLLLFPSVELQELLVKRSKEILGFEIAKNKPTIISSDGSVGDVLETIKTSDDWNQFEVSQ
jgi:chemotaxis protein CheC